MDRRPFLKLSPERRQIFTFALSQAQEILQMTQQELAQWLQTEMEKNPLFEFQNRSNKRRFEGDFPYPITLHEHLQNQIRENFSLPQDQMIAGLILEQLDERGFLTCPLESITRKPAQEILSILQTFDPPGIFARNLQESLLLQLKAKGKIDTLAYRLVETCFDELLHGRYTAIKKKLQNSDLSQAIRELARLSLRPASAFHRDPITLIHPDLIISKVDGGWTVELIEEELPKFQIQNEYFELEGESKEERESLRQFKTQARWICRSLNRRRKMLLDIAHILVCKQAPYLENKKPLASISIKELSEKLGLHESTLSRALSGKYASTPIGVIPLRSLITANPETETARQILEKLIQAEDKESPLTDDQLAHALKEKGFAIARRTIAKYRTQLKIGSAAQRKHSAPSPSEGQI